MKHKERKEIKKQPQKNKVKIKSEYQKDKERKDDSTIIRHK